MTLTNKQLCDEWHVYVLNLNSEQKVKQLVNLPVLNYSQITKIQEDFTK